MILKEAQFEVCGCCGIRKRVADPECGCDYCKKHIKLESSLNVTVFFQQEGTDDYHFCSWYCLLKKLPTIECDHFISLPYLIFDEDETGRRSSDFWEAVKGIANE